MPGHVKKTEGPDPCPDQWLIVSEELKVKLKAKPYDAKKSCWVPDKATGGYFEGLIENVEGEKATVKILETGDVSIDIPAFVQKLSSNIICSFSPRFSRKIKLDKSILQSLTVLMIWPV